MLNVRMFRVMIFRVRMFMVRMLRVRWFWGEGVLVKGCSGLECFRDRMF